jgi:hypothetical protein
MNRTRPQELAEERPRQGSGASSRFPEVRERRLAAASDPIVSRSLDPSGDAVIHLERDETTRRQAPPPLESFVNKSTNKLVPS